MSDSQSNAMEYHAMIYVRSKLRLFQLFKETLNDDRRTLFKTTCFGPWLDIIYVENDDDMIHYVLQKQCCSDDDNFDLPLIYHVNSHSLHFRHLVDDVYLRMVNDLDRWNSFPWGERIWRQLYDSIRNVSSKHKLEHFAGLKRNPNHVPSYSLTVFHFAFKAPIELAPTKDEVQCNWYAPSNDYFMWYVPRSPPVSIGGFYGEYLNKRSASRAAKKKSSEDFHPSECVREASLIDRVRDLECICETLLTLPKEVKSLRGRIHKLKSIIQSTFYPSRVVEKQETLKKVVPQIEDYLQSTSEDEPDIKDHTSPKEDDGNVYCCDDNGDVSLFFMPAKPVSQQTDQDLSSDLSVLNGFCNLSQTGEEKGDCEHYKYTYSSKQEDQIIRLVDQRQQDHISNMAEVAEQKIQSEIQRLYNHREARLNKIAEEDKQRKCLGHMNSSAHMKLAIERCVPKKRSLEVDWIRRIQVLDMAYWGFLGIRCIDLYPSVVFGECRHGYAVSSLMDTPY
ncbi:hypothetical protein Tco_0948691 [Tanacetum coccineum]